MKRMMLAGGLSAALLTPGLMAPALADGMFWVVGSHAANKCKIVTSNPVVDGADIWFVDGPYKSHSDANLARSTIAACPKADPGKDDADDEK